MKNVTHTFSIKSNIIAIHFVGIQKVFQNKIIVTKNREKILKLKKKFSTKT